MKKALHNLLSLLALILVLASCQDLAGPEGLPGEAGKNGADGENGLDAPLPPDIAAALSLALEAPAGGGAEPWAVSVSGLDLSDSYTARQIFHAVAAAIPDGDIDLDLSGCTGDFYGYNGGLTLKDRARFTGLTLPASLTGISDGVENFGAFAGFTALKTISAPGLLRVGDYAFFGCVNLETLDLPQVVHIGQCAFAANNSLSGSPALINTALTRVDLPQVKTIGQAAFLRCVAIAQLSLPELVETGRNAFAGTSEVPNRVLEIVDLPKAEFLDIGAFRYCNAIKTINLPNAGEILGYAFGAYYYDPGIVGLPITDETNTALVSVTLPEAGIVGGGIFEYCTALVSADLPVAGYIGNSLFHGCTALTTVNAPEAARVEDYSFEGCTSLVTLELPRVTSFGGAVFRSCTGLTSLKLSSATPPSRATTVVSGTFYPLFDSTGVTSEPVTILVPPGSLAAYNAAGWVDTAANGNPTVWGTNHKQIIVQEY
jgi:hypothetical protein